MEVSFAAVGDSYCFREEPMTAIEKVLPVIKAVDIAFCNLEAPLTDWPPRRPGGIRQSLKTVDMLRDSGFKVVSLANNHILDCGIEGLRQTLPLLEKNGIKYTGAGMNLSEARNPAIIERKGISIAFLAYASFFPFGAYATSYKPGIAVVTVDPRFEHPHVDIDDLAAMQNDIRLAKNKADIVIVSHHWGANPTFTLTAHQRAIGHAAIDAGADLVLGHHPHVLQGIEIYKGKIICHSLANFIFDPVPMFHGVPDVFRDGWRESMILNCYISDKKIERAFFYPIYINENWQPEILDPGDKRFQKILNLMERLSKPLGTTLTVKDNKVWI